LAGIFGFVDRAHFGASKHATLGSTIPPAIDGSHGAAVILCPARANWCWSCGLDGCPRLGAPLYRQM